MEVEKLEERLVWIHEEGMESARLFTTACFPKRFGKIKPEDEDIWLNEKKPKRWKLSADCMKMRKWVNIIETDAQKKD